MPVEYQVPGVYIEEIPAGSRPIQGVATAVAAFIGFTYTRPEGNVGQPVAINSWGEFVEKFCTVPHQATYKYTDAVAGEQKLTIFRSETDIYPKGAYLPHAVYGYFQNGGTRCYVESVQVIVDQTNATASLSSANQKQPAVLGLKKGFSPLDVSITIDTKVPPPDPDATAITKPSADEHFNVSIQVAGVRIDGKPLVEKFSKAHAPGARDTVKADLDAFLKSSQIVDVLKGDGAQVLIELITSQQPLRFTRSDALTPATTTSFRGNVSQRVGLAGLEEVRDVTMLICPDLMSVYEQKKAAKQEAAGATFVALVQNEMLTHCAKMQDRFAILDSLPEVAPIQMKLWREEVANYSKDDGKYGALYYPWIKIANPNATNGVALTIPVPPSGHIAGVYARVDDERGVHKAPANESIRGAQELERNLIDSEQSFLNPIGVNCIRTFPNRGILIWGARTLAEASSEWRYINVRRLFNFIEESIYEGTQWAVFEPNDMDLWARVRRSVTAFLTRVWQSGALFGATPGEAFYVKCDAELNTAAVRNAGQLIVEVGIAPVKPAEFVVFRFKQMDGGGEVSE